MAVRSLTAVAAATLLFGVTTLAQTPRPATPPELDKPKAAMERQQKGSADAQFVHEAAEGGMAEVKLGQLAAQKATSPEVKDFGELMASDHGKANQELASLAQQKNWHVPTELGAKHKALEASLQKLSGAAFDRAYMKEMVADHVKDVAAFKKQSTSAVDPDLKAWVTKTLPTLEKHLEMARSIEKKLATSTR